MPQATIKLQPAPAAAVQRKPVEPAPAAVASPIAAKAPEKSVDKAEPKGSTKVEAKAEDEEEEEIEPPASEIPFPLVIAVAVLALAAFGIQLWTYLL